MLNFLPFVADNPPRKSRRDLPRNSEKNIQKSKLSFSPYTDEEEDTKDRLIEKATGAQLSLKLPSKKLNGPVWVAGSSEEEKSPNSRDSQSLIGKDRNGNSMISVKQLTHRQSNGVDEMSPRESVIESKTTGSPPVRSKRRSDELEPFRSSGNDRLSPVKEALAQRKSSSSPDCVKIRKLLANRKTPPQESTAANGQSVTTANGSRGHSEESPRRDSPSREDLSKWEKADDLPVAYRSRSESRSGSSSRSRSRSMSRRSRSSSRRSDSRRRSSSRSSYSSRSRSKSSSSESRRVEIINHGEKEHYSPVQEPASESSPNPCPIEQLGIIRYNEIRTKIAVGVDRTADHIRDTAVSPFQGDQGRQVSWTSAASPGTLKLPRACVRERRNANKSEPRTLRRSIAFPPQFRFFRF